MKQQNHTGAVDYMACAACHCLASRQMARNITRIYDGYMQKSGIRATQFTILTQLMLRGELPISRLAAFLGMERTTLTRNLALLEQRKWISSKTGDDPRTRMIAITAPGRGMVKRGFPHWSEAQAHVGKLLGADGQAALKQGASKTLAAHSLE
jgi:DNA-binding MarR family transcriptional regulator